MSKPRPTSLSPRATGIVHLTLSACAVHCAVTPFIVGVLPLLGLGFIASPWFEWSMVAAAASLGGAGLGISYARAHRDHRPLVVFLIGLAVIVAGHLLLEQRDVLHALAAIGGAGLMYAAGRMNHDCSRHGTHVHS